METVIFQAAVATGPHLHVASLRSLYLKHAEFIVWLGREGGHHHQQQKGVLDSRRVETSHLTGQGLGKHLTSVAFTH